MCIRDRDAIDLKYAKQVADYLHADHTEVIINKDIVLDALESVIEMCIRDSIKDSDGLNVKTPTVRPRATEHIGEIIHIVKDPVSYTHLDVYKRQASSWASCRRAARGSTTAKCAWARAATTQSSSSRTTLRSPTTSRARSVPMQMCIRDRAGGERTAQVPAAGRAALSVRFAGS